MTTSKNWPLATGMEDLLQQMSKRIGREERRPSPIDPSLLLGPGLSARSKELRDWNDREATFNGFFYTSAGAANSPDSDLDWTGLVIAKDDGSGLQQVWNTGNPDGTLHYIRTYVPVSVIDDERVTFTEWQRFATASGLIDTEDLHPDVRQNIDQALSDAEEALGLVGSSNRVFRQPDMPVSDEDYTLQAGDTWFDTDDDNRFWVHDGTNWTDGRDQGIQAALDAAADIDAILADWTYTGTVEIDGGAIRADTVGAAQVAANAITAKHTLTGPVVQTTAAANRGIKMVGSQNSGYGALLAWNSSGQQTVYLNGQTGTLTLVGGVYVGGDIDGAVITGGTVQSSSAFRRGVKFNDNGLVAYDQNQQATFVIDGLNGMVTMRGELTSGSTVTGATIEGGLVRTAPPGTTRIEMGAASGNSDAIRFVGSDNSTWGTITAFGFSSFDGYGMQMNSRNQTSQITVADRYIVLRSSGDTGVQVQGDFSSYGRVSMPDFIQTGRAWVAITSANQNFTASVDFERDFPTNGPIPRVVASPQDVNGNTTIKVAIRNRTRSGFTIDVVRSSGSTNIAVDWIAVAT